MERIPIKDIKIIDDDDRTDQTETTGTVIRKKPNLITANAGLWLTLALVIQVGTVSSTYTVKPVEPGFYVEEIGTANIDRGVFRIETNFERNQLEQNCAKINTVTMKFRDLCNRHNIISEETHCKQFYHYLLEQGTSFDNTKEFLTEMNRSRRKRGLLGSLLTSVFGVNDEAYRDIDALQKNQDQLIDAANHQTKFMISAVAQLNNTERTVNKKLETFESQLNAVIKYVGDKDNWYSKMDRNSLNIQIMQTYELASNYIKEITDHYNGLLEIYSSKASVYSVLTPNNVSDIIASANRKLPSNLRIIQQLLIDTKIAENETHIQVYAYFPIQEVAKYTLLHVTPVPRKNEDGTFQSIELKKTYIAVDYNNELYFDMNHAEFKNCLQKLNHFICYPGVVKKMKLNENCVVDQIFTNHTQTKCLTKSFNLAKPVLWKQLYMQNTWLYIVKDQITASVVCDGQREEIELKNVGLIRISDSCIIKAPDHTLVAHRLVTAQTASSFFKSIDFNLHTYNSTKQIFNISRTEVVDNSNDILHHIIDGENNLKTELSGHVWNQITSHTYASSFVSSFIVLAVLLVMICYGPMLVRWVVRRFSNAKNSDPSSTCDNHSFANNLDLKNVPTYKAPINV